MTVGAGGCGRLGIGLVALVLTACGGSPTASGETEAPPSTISGSRILDGLCDAARLAPTDPAAAEAAFLNRAHDGIHALATDLEPLDRDLTARLLEAKQAAEAALRAPATPDSAVAPLRSLTEITRQGFGRLGVETGSCPP